MALDHRDTIPVPGPTAYPIIGNALDVKSEVPIERIAALGRQYGEIFSLWLGGKRTYFVSTNALLNELCDEKRFVKKVGGPLAQVRHAVHDGLFTANHGEENWGIAHRVLVPAFGPLPINGMFNSMNDIASQLTLKWARFGSDYKVPVTDDFTRLTLDTLALCAMDYRFNSFYTEEMHPFISAMVGFLSYAGVRARRPPFLHSWYAADEKKWQDDIAYMRNMSNDLVQARRDHPKDIKDLLNAMVNGKDPRSGKAMTDDSIIDNMITFLIAGHETTSASLSYIFYCLMKSPDAYRKAQQEVDEVIGTDSITEEHIKKLPYINAVIREAGRLYSTAPAFSVSPKSEAGETLGGKYHIPHGEVVVVILHNVHRDPAVYGDDAEEFKPERMLDENFEKLPPNAWKPFGNGERGCIGRGFAWQEMELVIAMLLQHFNFAMDDPAYTLQTSNALTIKPKDFFMRTTLREGWTVRKIEQHLSGALKGAGSNAAAARETTSTMADSNKPGKPITVLYGSNSGTCEVFAQTLAADARAHGFSASKVDTLDSAKGALPTGEPIAIVTASYEGEPCDNAAHFFDWLQNTDEQVKTKFAVFGCGHSDWKQTFHQVPKAIDRLLEKAGGQRLCDMGSANAAAGDMMSEFQAWEDETFWPALQKEFGGEDKNESEAVPFGENLTIEIFNKRASRLRADVSEARVLSAGSLTPRGAGEKRFIEMQLPSEMTYRAGDYLAILPLNPPETVHRVLKRFSLPWDAMLKISSRTGSTLPTDHPVSAHNLFSAYLELAQPATKRHLAMLLSASKENPEITAALSALDTKFVSEITDKRVSLLDLLERFPTLPLPLNAFISSLISMRVRQYSISSSPLSDPNNLTLTYAVLNAPALADGTSHRHIGVASNYMSSLQAGDIVHVAIRPSHASFRLPTDPENVPVIMVAAGAGLAPFRGFVQERAAQIGSGRKLAPARFYFGCRDPEKDDLYREEFDFWEKMGAVSVYRTFSQKSEKSEGMKHIDEALLRDKEGLLELWDRGARVYVCGSRGLGESVKDACLEIAKERAKKIGKDDSDERMEAWFAKIRNERFSTDVFA